MKTNEFYGFEARIETDISAAKLSELNDRLTPHLPANGVPSDYKIYALRVSFAIKERHFTVEGLSKRANSVKIEISIPVRAQKGYDLKFRDLAIPPQPDVRLTRSAVRTTFVLPATYIENTGEFEDYLVLSGDEGAHRARLKCSITTEPTAEYSTRLQSDRAAGATIIGFSLSRSLQIRLDL